MKVLISISFFLFSLSASGMACPNGTCLPLTLTSSLISEADRFDDAVNELIQQCEDKQKRVADSISASLINVQVHWSRVEGKRHTADCIIGYQSMPKG